MDEERRFAVYKAEYEQRIAERRRKVTHDTHAAFRAIDGWTRVENAEAWQQMVAKATEDLEMGGFLIDRLGAERYLDPELMAALLVLRRRLIDEYNAESAADITLIDQMAQAHSLYLYWLYLYWVEKAHLQASLDGTRVKKQLGETGRWQARTHAVDPDARPVGDARRLWRLECG